MGDTKGEPPQCETKIMNFFVIYDGIKNES